MTTPCMVIRNDGSRCTEPSHVILFASGTRFNGQDTYHGQMLAFCLVHGAQIYDVLHTMRKQGANLPPWSIKLPDFLEHSANQLPRVSPDRRGWDQPTPAYRPKRERRQHTRVPRP